MLGSLPDLPEVGCRIARVKSRGDGMYAVTEDGRVFSCASRGLAVAKGRYAAWRQLRPGSLTAGYLYVNLPGPSGKRSSALIHRLVAEAFLTRGRKATVDHIDGDKRNNHVSNLRWATYQENNAAAIALGIAPGIVGERNPGAKLTADDVRAIRGSEDPADVLARRFGVHVATIYFVRSGKTWAHVK